jgi:hypothetical protein
MTEGDGWRWGASRLVEHLVPVELAARMYGMNLRTWRHDPAVTARCSQESLDRLAKDLDERARSTGEPPVRWGLRQALLLRSGQTTQSAKGDHC